MATVQEVNEAIAAEAAEVKARFDVMEARIAELERAGAGATPEQLTEILNGVRGIFTPPA